MRDFNFFSIYIKKEQQEKRKKKMITLFAALFIFLIVGSFGITQLAAVLLRMNISEMNKYLSSEDIAAKRQHFEFRKRQSDILKEYITLLDNTSKKIDDTNIIKSSFIEDINKTLPAGVYFKNMAFTSSTISIVGSGVSKTAIAELYHNLDGLGIFTSVYIGSIQAEEGNLSFGFNLQCTLKDVINQ